MEGLKDEELTHGPNGTLVGEIFAMLSAQGKACDDYLEKAKEELAEAWQKLKTLSTSLSTAHKEQELAFRGLIEKHQQAQGRPQSGCNWKNAATTSWPNAAAARRSAKNSATCRKNAKNCSNASRNFATGGLRLGRSS